jgi:hypothetical protein
MYVSPGCVQTLSKMILQRAHLIQQATNTHSNRSSTPTCPYRGTLDAETSSIVCG